LGHSVPFLRQDLELILTPRNARAVLIFHCGLAVRVRRRTGAAGGTQSIAGRVRPLHRMRAPRRQPFAPSSRPPSRPVLLARRVEDRAATSRHTSRRFGSVPCASPSKLAASVGIPIPGPRTSCSPCCPRLPNEPRRENPISGAAHL